MRIIERFWVTVTCVVDWLTTSSTTLSGLQQRPISDSIHVDNGVSANQEHKGSSGLIFPPPTGQPGSTFTCDYSAMGNEWETCFDIEGCWLINKANSSLQYGIHTYYENDGPTGTVRQVTLTASDGKINADGMTFQDGKWFNGQFPGPWIQACWGDKLVITVNNELTTNGTSIHWHGIRQLLTMPMDGVNGITQCPSKPGDSFTYTWNATQYGSSWYHSHYSVQYADGLLGPITLHDPTSSSFDEAQDPLIMTDWGHNSAFDAIVHGLKNPDILLGGPTSVTGNINRFSGNTINTTTIPPIYQMTFQPPVAGVARRYLLRLIHVSFDTTFIFTIDNHGLEVISADFVPIHPYPTESVLIGIGQRYNVIVTANQSNIDSGNFWIRTYVADDCGTPGSVASNYERTGILRYNSADTSAPTSTPWANIPTACSDELYSSIVPMVQWTVGPAANARNPNDEQFSVSSDTGANPYPLASFSLKPANLPGLALQVNYSDPIMLHLADSPESFPPKWVVIPETHTKDDWIHLHGHDFAILYDVSNSPFTPASLNYTCVDPPTDLNPLRCNNPPRRDVVLLPTGGFVVIAFRADNPVRRMG